MKKKIPSYNFIIKDVITHNFSTLVVDEKGGERVYVLINKNSRIPYENIQKFTTYEDNQTVIDFNYCECDSDDVDEFKRNKMTIVKDIPPMKKGNNICVKISVDESGLITMELIEL